ncbi:tetratricopeptide repeat protein [Paraglaciecola sp. 20A4]|uniref:tetratricopeptide repeat protein n=1 Tax=Paraglaciecola sp. 20A4 TaxID=2687288 RepID=UPI001408E802|nr:tetratricopeptide repeat protein [Paraglaciecola sp. 20A4]
MNVKKLLLSLIVLMNFTSITAAKENEVIRMTTIEKYMLAKDLADKGDTNAMLDVFAIFYSTYPELESKAQESANYLMQSASRGNINAQYNMGYLQQTGDLFEKNVDKAIVWLRKASEQGHVKSNRQLGFIYLELYKVNLSKDCLYAESKNWFSKGAKLGDYPSLRQLALGILAHEQEGHDEALKMLEEAFAHGDARSARYLGMYSILRYEEYGDEEYFNQAVGWYQKSAMFGDNISIRWLQENFNKANVKQPCVKN